MACKNCCEDTACCIHSFFDPIPGVRYPLIKTVGVPTIGQCVNLPRGVCGNGFMVPGSPYVWQGTPKNINCERADCSSPPCLCCCEGQCFEVPCDDLTGCTAGGGTVVESCDDCEDYDESLRGACCSQECDGFHCRRMTECECLKGAESAGRRYVHFAGPGTECEVEERCCIDGSVNGEHATQSACETAGGTWVTGHACDQHPCGSPTCNCFCDGENPCPAGCDCVDGQCVTPTSETCDYLACVTFEWDLEYLSWLDYQSNKTTWIPSTGTATIRCASESRQLITVSLSSCFGSGATAEVTAPVGYERADMGPITAVSYSPGSGYAKLGREAPTLTVSGGTGTGATFTPTLSTSTDACGIPTWSLKSVTVSGGKDYVHNETLTVTTKSGDTTVGVAVVRVQTDAATPPTLTASVSGGSGATFGVSVSSNGDSPQTYGVSGVSVTGSTSGYTNNAAVTFTPAAGVTEIAAAEAHILTARTTPTITASASGGSGASLTVSLSQSPTTPSDTALWHVDSVAVADGGTGYTDGDPVTFTVTDGTEVVAAAGTVDVRPTLDAYVADTSGTGATLTPTLSQSGEYWTVTGVTIGAAGTGYEVDQLILFTPTGTSTEIEAGVWIITSVDGNGGITGVAPPDEISSWGGVYDGGTGPIERILLTGGGDYYKATGAISRVIVTEAGQYVRSVPTGVTVQAGGTYYREDASLPPYVAEVTATISQSMPSEGTGGELAVVVDDDTGSATFGQVTVSIADGGDGYLAQRTVHPDALLLMCFDSNDEQDENLAPNFPATGDQLEWLMPAGGSEPGITLGFPMAVNPCCYRSFVAFPDAGFTLADDPYTAIAVRNGTYFELEDEDDVVVIRGTVTETLAPVWFAEDCDCANPLP